MLHEEDTGFELLVAANQNRRNSPKPQRVGSNEIFRISGEVVLLTAAQAELTNLLEEWSQLVLTDDEFGGAFTPILKWTGASPVEGKTIGHRIVDTK